MSTGSAEAAVTQQYASPPVTIILTVVFLVFFFVGFFSIYFCRCFLENLLYSWYIRRPPNTAVGPACPNGTLGIEQSIIESFPTFTYASVKDLRKEKYGLECAICLCEFADEDALRLLTKCCHVFHQECIDLWLESHKTCPVCRRDLDEVGPVGPDKSPTPSNMHGINENEPLEDRSYSITIADDNDDARRGNNEEQAAAGPAAARPEDQSEEKDKVEAFGRSKSTGHSIVRSGSNHEDRFTLRLPEHLHAKLIRGHNWTGSCTTFGEFKSKISTGHGGFGEVSSGNDDKVQVDDKVQ